MDSLTQIVLGAAVGEAVLGRKIGNKAMLYGAIAGTIPDLDILASNFTDTVNALEIHRGFTHSIFFAVIFAPLFGWLVSRWERAASWKSWSWLFFWGLFTHPLLDGFTTWGTQLFWPLDIRLAFKSIFVIDPLYTLPFLTFLILTMRQKRTSLKRKRYNQLGLLISSLYLVLGLVLKGLAFQQFEKNLETQKINYFAIETKPTPFNTILWTANVDTPTEYLIGHYSFFDSQPIQFTAYSKNHEKLGTLKTTDKIKQLIKISKGWYTITEENGELYFNDLRFGLMRLDPKAENFVFSYKIEALENGTIKVTEKEKNPRDGKALLKDLWQRIGGN
ncbi:metal-dependent hydrolase [Haloflavibacter putidus]|uniref:Metal-dependent hydrolase n=1 Tax=Haloflavibacter putidus TaxID=2576776 RepID=A0A507ZPC9_9FLAO|nr:metal-dependent hydrolase [Haloflavibacter putidus]TQD38857.1 metal-dependent hydrolase [Haloflavibacter putidus]